MEPYLAQARACVPRDVGRCRQQLVADVALVLSGAKPALLVDYARAGPALLERIAARCSLALLRLDDDDDDDDDDALRLLAHPRLLLERRHALAGPSARVPAFVDLDARPARVVRGGAPLEELRAFARDLDVAATTAPVPGLCGWVLGYPCLYWGHGASRVCGVGDALEVQRSLALLPDGQWRVADQFSVPAHLAADVRDDVAAWRAQALARVGASCSLRFEESQVLSQGDVAL
eukprot:m51a1_g926 hypothetical protein (234) ;mRNA; r:204481-205266